MQKVLLVNDCRFESIVMKDILKNLECDTVITNEYEAMGEAREFLPDIVICNLIMKDTRGNLLIEKIKSLYPQMRCYLSSSNAITLEEFRKYKVDGVMQTPATRDKLKMLLEEAPNIADKLTAEGNENTTNIRKSLKLRAYCPYCGEQLSNYGGNIAFCPYCGKKF